MLLDQPGLFFGDVIARNARFFANKPAAICGRDSLTWSEFDARTNRVANHLADLGLRKGDRVCLLMANSIPMFELIWGTIKAGGVVVPLNVMMAKEALPAMIGNAAPRAIFADSTTFGQIDAVRSSLTIVPPGNFQAIGFEAQGWASAERGIAAASSDAPTVETSMSDSMNIIYSSGTTGVPKGIEHSYFARLTYTLGFAHGLKIDRFSKIVCATPLYTNGTWITMLPAVFCGATIVILPRFSAENFLSAVDVHDCTHVFMVPTQYIMVLESGLIGRYDVSSLEVVATGGQTMPSSVFDRCSASFPDAGLYEIYGLTEGFLTLGMPGDWAMGKRGSVGKPLFDADLAIVDPAGNRLPTGETGEIVAYGSGLMKGYFKDTARTEEMIWHDANGRTYIRSGDVGYIDEDGYVFVSGRMKDMIKSGGVNIFAVDIEDVFTSHPDVVEAAAIGVPDPKWGETPVLLAIIRDGSSVSPSELQSWGNARLGKWQRVAKVEYCDDFPRGTYNKVLKRELRDIYSRATLLANASGGIDNVAAARG